MAKGIGCVYSVYMYIYINIRNRPYICQCDISCSSKAKIHNDFAIFKINLEGLSLEVNVISNIFEQSLFSNTA